MAKGKGTSGRSGGPWKGGPQRGKISQQPFSPRKTKDVTARPPRKNRGAPVQADEGQAGKPAPTRSTRSPRPSSPDNGFARQGRAQPGRTEPTQRAERPTREGGKANKPWANRPAAERRAERAAQGERR
ncbi:MAG: hypothetical protein ACYDAR_18485, partial [Thermomicrobiales bacterium]